MCERLHRKVEAATISRRSLLAIRSQACWTLAVCRTAHHSSFRQTQLLGLAVCCQLSAIARHEAGPYLKLREGYQYDARCARTLHFGTDARPGAQMFTLAPGQVEGALLPPLSRLLDMAATFR